MNRKTYIITIISLIICSYGLSQTRLIDPILSMPSPTVTNLAKYIDFPERNQYDTVPMEIPLWDLKYKDFSIPFKFGYNANGIQVSKEAGWVGLEWGLNSTGFISRSFRELADDIIVCHIAKLS